MTVGGMGFIPERNFMTMMMMMNTLYCVKPNKKKYNHHYINTAICDNSNSYLMIDPFSSVLEFVCLPWSEVCSARVTSLLLLLLLLLLAITVSGPDLRNTIFAVMASQWSGSLNSVARHASPPLGGGEQGEGLWSE